MYDIQADSFVAKETFVLKPGSGFNLPHYVENYSPLELSNGTYKINSYSLSLVLYQASYVCGLTDIGLASE